MIKNVHIGIVVCRLQKVHLLHCAKMSVSVTAEFSLIRQKMKIMTALDMEQQQQQ
jgi:hypothetical protein